MHMQIKSEQKLKSDSSEPHAGQSGSSLPDNVRCRRVSGRQLELLWEYLNAHRDIAVAFNRSLQAKEYSQQRWKVLAEILNFQGDGAHKDWKGWSKYWVDYKAKLKKRISVLRFAQARNGAGQSSEPPLSDIENKFLQILGEDYGQKPNGELVENFEAFEVSFKTGANCFEP
ncbi:jg21810 [Pararge aegeria aegeria]|uniref:Regulatory protein zeste n=1 Tax=Pararge aegeria aegeria TaxID=348720 RepID=A0A8S4QFS0_9NEOP|nr:jg21810 [Pararge aegeria aegeria]